MEPSCLRSLAVCVMCVGLAACGTSSERCAREVSRDLGRIEDLIAETKANIARGYRYETEYRSSAGFGIGFCTRSGPISFCGSQFNTPRRVAVAIDPAEERAKLDNLESREAALRNEMAQGYPQCPP